MQSSETPPQPRVRLTEARLNRGLSQQNVAETIQTTHVNVSRWERGITKPSPYFRRKLSKLFGKSEEELDLIPPAPASEVAGANGTAAALKEEEKTVAVAESLPINTDLPPIYDPAIPLKPAKLLIGRERELGEIKKQLQDDGNVALTALNGLPGVGKTALSVALAHDQDLRQHFKDGILWAGLGPEPNMPGLLSRWGTLLGISANQMASLSNNEAWAKAIRNAIGMRSMLLVLDDAWKLEEALMVRVGGPNCAHLVTTRFPTIAAHMTTGDPTIIHELGEQESIELLSRLAPQAVAREAQKVVDLVQAVGGLPLALTLMGNYLRKQAASGPARRITAALEKLSNAETRLQIEEPHIPAESHPSLSVETPLSLQSVIAVTDLQLEPLARATLYALAVFPPKPNTFSEEAALVVAACTIDELDALSDSGLLEINGGERYQLHQIIADYAWVNLKGEELAGAQGRFVDYIVDYVEEHRKDYELLELESGTILAALELAYTLKMQIQLARSVCAFAPFLLLRGFYSLADIQLTRAYEAAKEQKDSYNLAGVLLYLGEVVQKQGDFVQAENRFEEGLALARQVSAYDRICDLLNELGWVKWRRGEFAQADKFLQEGLKLAREHQDRERICALLKVLGSLEFSQGNYIQADKFLQEGLTLARQIGDREQIFIILINLGAASAERGQYDLAETYYLESLEIARQIGHREGISALLANLGDTANEQEKYDKAEKYFQEGLAMARKIGHKEWISAGLFNFGLMERKRGNLGQSAIYLEESLTLARQIGRPQIIANALYEYGNLHLDQNEPETAKDIFSEMLNVTAMGSQELIALAQYGLARIAYIQNDAQEARTKGEQSAVILETIGHRRAKEVRYWLDTIKN